MQADSAQSAPSFYLLDTRTVVFTYRNEYLLISPTRRNWTKISAGAYQLLLEGERQPIPAVLQRAQAGYGFGPQEVLGFLTEMRARDVIYFDIDQGPRPEMADIRDSGAEVAFLNVTRRCNLTCPTCLAAAGVYPLSDDAPLAAWQDCMDKLAAAGTKTVIVTGGEPTMRKDILDLLHYARSRFERVFLNTNGTFLTPATCSRLRDLVDQVHVSVDGSTAELHDSFRGQGSFQRTLNGIRLLKEAGVNGIGITPTLTKVNIHDLPNVADLAISLGVGLKTSVFLPVGRGACNASELSPSPQQLVKAFRDTHAAILKHSDEEIEPQRNFFGGLGGVKTKCGAARWTISVMGDGVVYPCNALCEPEFVMGNLREQEAVSEILAESPVTRQFDAMTIETRAVCSQCDIRYFCGGGCFAHSYLAHGDLEALDPFCYAYRNIWRSQMWTFRADASLRQNVQAMVDWLDSRDGQAPPTEISWAS